MQIRNLSLRLRIFISMILLTLLSFLLIAIVTIHQYKVQADEYHESRLKRKEGSIKKSIDVVLDNTTFELITQKLPYIFKDAIFDLKKIHNLDISIYDLEGNLLLSSFNSFIKDSSRNQLYPGVLEGLSSDMDHRIVIKSKLSNENIQSVYFYLTDRKYNNIGILNLEYVKDNSEQNRELEQYLSSLAFVYIFIFVFAIIIAYFLSSYITRSIITVSEKIKKTRLNKRNEKIALQGVSAEIFTLVNSYNEMIDELEDSAVKLAKGEREQAWREMAKQVAHEIKNPLTPMRLTVQSYERKFDPNNPDTQQKLHEFCKSLIQQIDTMSSIASAFSDFAKMPTQKKEDLNVVEVVKLSIDIFALDYIYFQSNESVIMARLDKTQLIRVMTNLVKNATQAMEGHENPKIIVSVQSKKDSVQISVSDNGKGIPEDLKAKVFEPKFTTKTSGMGLGLPMVKNIIEAYKGTIKFTSEAGKGTIFTINLPKN